MQDEDDPAAGATYASELSDALDVSTPQVGDKTGRETETPPPASPATVRTGVVSASGPASWKTTPYTTAMGLNFIFDAISGENSPYAKAMGVSSIVETILGASSVRTNAMGIGSSLQAALGINSAYVSSMGIASTMDAVIATNGGQIYAGAFDSILDTVSRHQKIELGADSALSVFMGKPNIIDQTLITRPIFNFLSGANPVTIPASITTSILEGTSDLAGWRESMLGARTATALFGVDRPIISTATRKALADLARTSSVTARLASTAAGAIARQPHLWPSQAPAVRLGLYLQGLAPGSLHRELLVGISGGSSVSALLAADLLSHDPDSDNLKNTIEVFEDDVASPWLSGPAQARTELLEALGGLGDDLPGLLLGAWDDVERAGPAAAVKISTCTVEVLERTLRILAPDDDVLFWHARENRPSNEVSNERPTYGCRVRYLLRAPEQKKYRQLMVAQVDNVVVMINQLRAVLQGGKHASVGDVVMLRGCLLAVEALLHQLIIRLW